MPFQLHICLCRCVHWHKVGLCLCVCECLILLNQRSHFFLPSSLSVASGDKNHLWLSKMTENNGEISSASFSSPIYSTCSEWALSGRTNHDITSPFSIYLDFISHAQSFHFRTDWSSLFNSFIHLCLQAVADVTVNKNWRALQAPLLPHFLCVQSGSREFNRGRMLWLLNGFPGSHGLEN